jgi:hypothetical protein
MLTSVRDGKETCETRYFISSLPVGVKLFARVVRSDWAIENSCHWCRDFIYREDESRIRDEHLREIFAWLNRFTLSLPETASCQNQSGHEASPMRLERSLPTRSPPWQNELVTAGPAKRIIQPKRCLRCTSGRNTGRTGEPTRKDGGGGLTEYWYSARNLFRDLSSSFSLAILINLFKDSVVLVSTQICQQSCRRFGFIWLPAGRRSGKLFLSIQHRHLNLDFLPFGNTQILVKFDHLAMNFSMDCPGHR